MLKIIEAGKILPAFITTPRPFFKKWLQVAIAGMSGMGEVWGKAFKNKRRQV